MVSAPILATGMGFSLPVGSTVLGASLSIQAKAVGTGTPSLNVELAFAGNPIGTLFNVPINGVLSTYVAGSTTYQWGTALTTDIINGSLGLLVQAVLSTTGTSAVSSTFSVNELALSVYYTTIANSEALQVKTFVFSLANTVGISGVGVAFEAYSNAATTATLQLLKNSVPVGSPKTIQLTTTPTVYFLGAPGDTWGTSLVPADVNSTNFGVQITASGLGTTYAKDLDTTLYIIPSLTNFNYIKTYEQNTGQIDTLALDSSGILWKEDVTNNENVLAVLLSGIIPGSFAKSATFLDREYILFSDLKIGTDRPRVFNGSGFSPLSQVGPGAPPSFSGSSGTSTSGTGLVITSYTISGNVITYTYTAGPTTPAEGQVYTISGATPTYLNITGVVLGVPAPDATHFSMELIKADIGATAITATAVLQFNYPIASITQNAQHPTNGTNNGGIFWGADPGPTHDTGSNLIVYYSEAEDTVLRDYYNAHQMSTYVYLGTLNNFPQFSNKTYLITGIGLAKPSGTAGAARFYFMVNVGQSGKAYPDNTTGTYQLTIATVTTSTAVPDLNAGDTVRITGETPTSWNQNWSIVESLKSSILTVLSTTLSAAGVATYTYSIQPGSPAPVAGQLVSVTQCTNSGLGFTTSPFNTIGVIATVGGGAFTINGFPINQAISVANENGIAETYGTQFSIDPGALTIGSSLNPIYGNAGASSAGNGIWLVQSAAVLTPGTRQGVVFFITDDDYFTMPSPPIVFTMPANTVSIYTSNIPIGPPNVKARGIAFTEAGQNGIPGANFYYIPNPVTVQVQNGAPLLYTPTVIHDNTTTNAKFTFSDSVLLNSVEIDIQGNNLFNLIELGSSAWCVPYASRMFYGLQLNKVQNFNNLTFDGGYIPNLDGNNLPLGWSTFLTNNETELLVSPVTGMALYTANTTGSLQAQMGMINQPAYRDAYQVPIIQPSVTYSVRVACSNPSGVSVGNLVLDLVDFNTGIGFGTVYGAFSVPLSSMNTVTAVFTGTLLTTPFTNEVSPLLQLRHRVTGMGDGADVLVDRIEVFPTEKPHLLTEVFGSYPNNPESLDASGDGGILDTSEQNAQPCMGGFVMREQLYFLKTNSMYSTRDNPNSQPGGWSLNEISNRVGSIGIHSYDIGEEWGVTACRAGIFVFNGGQPVKIMQEIYQLWEAINWGYGYTIVLRNDIINKRILCAVPLPTGTSPAGVPTKSVQWLPYAPYNPNPTTPNVMLMLNYQGLATVEELMGDPEMRVTMFGTLAVQDMKRKWTIWQIPSPYMDYVLRQDNESKPLFVCNGINSSKIYYLDENQKSDDGVAIYSLYTTYGHVNAAKAATIPIFGMHAKRYLMLQATTSGSGNMKVRIFPNILDAKYPYTVPVGIKLSDPAQDDYFRPINARANRAFLEFSTNAVGSWFVLHKTLLSGKADPWASVSPTGGGNAGIVK